MSKPLTSRCALVVGGTAGIGEAIAVNLASRGASVSIAGRRSEIGAAVVERMRAASATVSSDAGASFEFIRLDASSLEGTRAFTNGFTAARAGKRLDFLVMCQTKSSFGGREETSEGFELKLTLHAYSRFLLARDLLPSLRLDGSSDRDVGAGRVLSVLSGGVHSPFTDWADADLRESFSLKRAADAGGFYNDLAFQHMADDPDNAGVGFLHAAPGFVASTWGHQTKAAFLIKIAQKLFAKSTDACAEIMVNAMCDSRYATGFHCVGGSGDPAKKTSAHTAENIAAMQAHLASVYATALRTPDHRP
jgi:NAD(P)-dependent dehydrogenase (short-subunit alcohol dehydrogenase family)